jgi:hypothetical protein
MHAAIRVYNDDATFRAITDRVEVGLAPQLRRMPGFRTHLVVRCPGKLGMVLVLFDSAETLTAALEVAQDWGVAHLSDLLAETTPSGLYLGETMFAPLVVACC